MGAVVVVFLLLAMSVAVVTLTVCKSKLFRPLRRLLKANVPAVGELVACTFCTSVWVAAAHAVVFMPVLPREGNGVASFVVDVFALAGVAAIFVWVVFHAHASIPHSDDEGGES